MAGMAGCILTLPTNCSLRHLCLDPWPEISDDFHPFTARQEVPPGWKPRLYGRQDVRRYERQCQDAPGTAQGNRRIVEGMHPFRPLCVGGGIAARCPYLNCLHAQRAHPPVGSANDNQTLPFGNWTTRLKHAALRGRQIGPAF
jgi:hypothetical protein